MGPAADLSFPRSCSYCPHLDRFHSNCDHPLNQAILRELAVDDELCPVYSDVRNEEMGKLEDRLSELELHD